MSVFARSLCFSFADKKHFQSDYANCFQIVFKTFESNLSKRQLYLHQNILKALLQIVFISYRNNIHGFENKNVVEMFGKR